MRAKTLLLALAIVIAAGFILVEAIAFLSHIGAVSIIAIGATLLAFLVFPVVRSLNWWLPLWASLAVVYVGVLLAVILVLWLLIPGIIDQIQALSRDLPSLELKASTAFHRPDRFFSMELPAELRADIAHLPERVGSLLQRESGAISASLLRVAESAAVVAAIVVAIPVTSIYMLAESEAMKRFLLSAIPESAWMRTLSLLEELERTVGGFIRGQLIVAAVVATLVTLLLLTLQVPYALLIGVFAGVMDVIPYIGAVAGYLPAALVSLVTNGWSNAFYVSLGFIAINQLEGHLIVPRVVGNSVRLRPLAVIFALLVGGELFGLPGLLVAVPVAGIVRVLVLTWMPARIVPHSIVRAGLSQHPQRHTSSEE